MTDLLVSPACSLENTGPVNHHHWDLAKLWQYRTVAIDQGNISMHTIIIFENRTLEKCGYKEGLALKWCDKTKVHCILLFLFTDVDECLTNICGVNASCFNTLGSFVCSCPDGLSGPLCTVGKSLIIITL